MWLETILNIFEEKIAKVASLGVFEMCTDLLTVNKENFGCWCRSSDRKWA